MLTLRLIIRSDLYRFHCSDLYRFHCSCGVDILDGTPLLDIKPYVRQFDIRENVRSGWFDERRIESMGVKSYTPKESERP